MVIFIPATEGTGVIMVMNMCNNGNEYVVKDNLSLG